MMSIPQDGDRVRALALTPDGKLLLIKRVRPGSAAYWVFPGGGVEPEDETREVAISREIHEELGGSCTIRKMVFDLVRDDGDARTHHELYYLVDIDVWDEALRTGPEFGRVDSGQYIYDEVGLDAREIAGRDIKPETMKDWLLANFENLGELPDLRD